jgi:hypothetical protein
LPTDQFERLSSLVSEREFSSDQAIQALKRECGTAFRTIDSFGQDIRNKSHGMLGIYEAFIFQPNKSKNTIATHFRGLLSQTNYVYSASDKADTAKTLGLTGTKLEMALRLNLAGRLMCFSMLPPFNSFIEHECNKENNFSATRIAIAFQRYLKKEGHPPESLADLVPTYLPAVPRDAYDGQPFRYLPKEKLLYSVDKDLKDSKAIWWTEGKKYSSYRDQVYPLTPDAKPKSAP